LIELVQNDAEKDARVHGVGRREALGPVGGLRVQRRCSKHILDIGKLALGCIPMKKKKKKLRNRRRRQALLRVDPSVGMEKGYATPAESTARN